MASKTSAQAEAHSTNKASGKDKSGSKSQSASHPSKSQELSSAPSKGASSKDVASIDAASKDVPSKDKPSKEAKPKTHHKPLILYAFAESEAGRTNLKFFVSQGLHDAADFIFILNGETDIDSTIPKKDNIKVVRRPNTCFDLGAYGEILRTNDLYKNYKRFIMMNASIRGPFLPHWAESCWSDLYLDRLTDKVKLVGMTANCWPQFHVQSMIWATDDVGMELLINPPAGSSEKDNFGSEEDSVGLAGCYDDWNHAVHAEVGTTKIFTKQGYKVDLMMTAYHKSKNYIEECDTTQNGDVLWDGKYFGTNVHPFETIFIKANRNIDPILIDHLTTWQQDSGYSSYDACRVSS
ncbi:hypothetical protein CCHL11_00537 [Colletotrichum chlorophyti]|uniref:Uncharacterized protein n=1 Tax=Colletotrichum chlorophyti TaxID=708187 RepID=A0A1Q8RTW7_9PEZI|nr:hypothetical protein CCHL11_00537 [Colletotrichum chlorophyti]